MGTLYMYFLDIVGFHCVAKEELIPNSLVTCQLVVNNCTGISFASAAVLLEVLVESCYHRYKSFLKG